LTHWRYASATDTGLVRETNQDAIYVDSTLAVVADGMGGHAAGEVASALTIDLVCQNFREKSTWEGLFRAIEAANRAIIADARENPERFGMGTTVIAVGLTKDAAGVVSPTLFNVGDSRAYQLRDGALRQLSEDHSVAEEWVRMGRLTSEEAQVHPRRHQLTRALGVEDELQVDVSSIDAEAGDRILLCSDGLSNELSGEELVRLASAPMPLEDAVNQLVEAARQAGGRDNISAILLEFDDVTLAATPIKKTMKAMPAPEESNPKPNASFATRRRRRFTWRVGLSVVVFLMVLGGCVLVVHWYAYSTYYLGDDAGTVALYQGQPNGVLWYKPVKVLDTKYKAAQLRPADRQELIATIEEPTRFAARREAGALYGAWLLGQTPSSATTTTTLKKAAG
jgi:protein phosphatase